MRGWPLLALTWTACPADDPCTLDECLDICEARGTPTAGLSPEGAGPIVTPFELEQIRPMLDDLRAGVRVPQGMAGLCRGTAGCDTRLPPGDRVPEGTWHIHVPFEVPALARPSDWTAALHVQCLVRVERDGITLESTARSSQDIDLGPLDEGRGRYDGPAIVSPSPRGTEVCAWRVTFRGPGDARTELEGRYTLPGPDGRVLDPPSDAPRATPPERPPPPPDAVPRPETDAPAARPEPDIDPPQPADDAPPAAPQPADDAPEDGA